MAAIFIPDKQFSFDELSFACIVFYRLYFLFVLTTALLLFTIYYILYYYCNIFGFGAIEGVCGRC